MNEDDKYYDLIGRFVAGEISDADRNDLMAWVEADAENQTFFEELTKIWNVAGEAADDFDIDTSKAWNQIESKIDQHDAAEVSSTKVRRLTNTRRWAGIAAAVAAVLIVGYMWISNGDQGLPNENLLMAFETSMDQQKEIELPDGSKVWLNENSSLSYQMPFEQRSIELVGEAFFDVERMEESPFEISSGATKTVVLGTSFNVRAYPVEEKIEVTVETGKVAFSETASQAAKVLIPAGQSAVYVKKEQKVLPPAPKIANAVSWKKQQLAFDNISMEEVIQSLERHFNIKIEVDNPKILNCRANGTYPNPTAENMFEVLKFMLFVEVSERDGKYILSGEGC